MSPNSQVTARLFFLMLLFSGTICSSMIIPYMGFFLVEGLGYDPWIISVYATCAVSITLLANRQFARKIDSGVRVFPLIGMAAFAFLVASTALLIFPSLWTVMTVGVLGFGLSSSAISTMFSLGGNIAERHGMVRSRFNAYMRATTSTGWMIGPAATFLIADLVSIRAVFAATCLACLVWLALWWLTLPRDITASAKASEAETGPPLGAKTQLWLATAFVFCLSLAHALTFTSLPIFYVQEVGLPGYAPGLAFSVKTLVEVGAIFCTPWIILKVGMGRALLATSLLAVVTTYILATVQTLPQMFAGAAMEGLYYGFFASLGISYIQSFARDRPARATTLYWNTLMMSGLLAGPAVGLVAQAYDFQTVLYIASVVALISSAVLLTSRRFFTA